MRHFSALILLLAVAGCGPVSPSQRLTPGTYTLRVEGFHVFPRGYADARFAPWRRSGDEMMDGPIFVLVAAGGEVCVVPDEVWAITPMGVPATCAWRLPRPAGGRRET